MGIPSCCNDIVRRWLVSAAVQAIKINVTARKLHFPSMVGARIARPPNIIENLMFCGGTKARPTICDNKSVTTLYILFHATQLNNNIPIYNPDFKHLSHLAASFGYFSQPVVESKIHTPKQLFLNFLKLINYP